jgi:molybdopterin molybdotransferase
VRRRAEDVPLNRLVVQSGATLDARHLAILSAVGHCYLPVRKKIDVSVFSTGDELAGYCGRLPAGKIFDSNRPMMMGLLAALPRRNSLSHIASPSGPR